MNQLITLCRRIFCRGGFGVHSPFVFDVITHVIEERGGYYFYDDIASAHRRLASDKSVIDCAGQHISVGKALGRYGLTLRECKLLFRLANRFMPRRIITVGSSMGLAPLCLTGYTSDEIVEIITENVEERIGRLISGQAVIDCLYLGRETDADTHEKIFTMCSPAFGSRSFIVVAGIRDSTVKKRLWMSLCNHPNVTVAIDACSLGILFTDPLLPRRIYKSY